MRGLGDSNIIIALVPLLSCPEDVTKLATPHKGHDCVCATLSLTAQLATVYPTSGMRDNIKNKGGGYSTVLDKYIHSKLAFCEIGMKFNLGS